MIVAAFVFASSVVVGADPIPGAGNVIEQDVAAVTFVGFVAPTFRHRLNTRFDDNGDVLFVARAGVAFDVSGRAECKDGVFVVDGDARDGDVVVGHVHGEVRGCSATKRAMADKLSAELTAFRKAAYTRAVDVIADVPALKDADPARLRSTITLGYDEPLGCGPVVATAQQSFTLIVVVDGKQQLLHQLQGTDAHAAVVVAKDVVGKSVGAALTPVARTITKPPQ